MPYYVSENSVYPTRVVIAYGPPPCGLPIPFPYGYANRHEAWAGYSKATAKRPLQ